MSKSVNLSKSKLEDSVDFKSSEKNSKTVRKFSVNLADDCEMVGTPTVTSEGSTYEADPSNPLSVIATQIDEKSGKFAIVIAGGLKKDSSQISGGSGSGNNKLEFAGTGNYVIGCDNILGISPLEKSKFVFDDRNIIDLPIILNTPVTKNNTFKVLLDELSAGRDYWGYFKADYNIIDSNVVIQCNKCLKTTFLYKKVEVSCKDKCLTRGVPVWSNYDKCTNPTVTQTWDAICKKIKEHEEQHCADFIRHVFTPDLDHVLLEGVCCKNADKDDYESLDNNTNFIWKNKYKEAQKIYDDFQYRLSIYEQKAENLEQELEEYKNSIPDGSNVPLEK